MTNNTTFARIRRVFNLSYVSGALQFIGAVLNDSTETGGTFVCNGATPVTVTEPAITANSAVDITLKTVGGTVGAVPAIQTITPGTGFTVAGTAGDTSTYNYLVTG